MRMKFVSCVVSLFLLGFSVTASASQITFTGGTVTQNGGTTATTNNFGLWDNVDFYEEAGFRLDFIGNTNLPSHPRSGTTTALATT